MRGKNKWLRIVYNHQVLAFKGLKKPAIRTSYKLAKNEEKKNEKLPTNRAIMGP